MKKKLYATLLCVLLSMSLAATVRDGRLSGRVTDGNDNAVPLASVALEGTTIGCHADEDGFFLLEVPMGEHTLAVSAVGYATARIRIAVAAGDTLRLDTRLNATATELDGVVVSAAASGAWGVKRSAFNVVAMDTEGMLNSAKNLGDVLAKAPGVKLRETGGLGSDLQVTMDGFTGKHVKIFIDGVPQEGVGGSFGLNNIPVNFAERIEVYRGVVPVGFGTDALGGVVNIVTAGNRPGWRLDASYSYGSFNTHRAFVDFSRSLRGGFFYSINAMANYSDNNYHVYAPVEDFATGRIERDKLERVERFNDTYHNEAVSAKIGVTGRPWADRLAFGITLSQMYKDIQTGVRQVIVYGHKHRKSHSVMPTVEYVKRNALVKGLDVSLSAGYNRNATTNVDTAMYKYNWRGDKQKLNSPGEQSRLYSRADNDNWNASFTANWRVGGEHTHLFTLNHVLNAFERSNTSLLAAEDVEDAISKRTTKNITGLSYRLMPSEVWNVTLFGKYYALHVAGPVPETTNADSYVRSSRTLDSYGYGMAGTYFPLPGLQVKLSYEKALRLPSVEEMFGDEDLEMGDISIKPESSHNVNVNVAWNASFGAHTLYAEGGLVYRDTRDYIQRNIIDLSGGKAAATYINYGKVLTKGWNASLRYSLGKWLSLGGNFTRMDVLDNMPVAINSTAANLGYKERMPNLPYLFADFDAAFNVPDFLGRGNVLTVAYENRYVKEFSYYSSKIGANKGDYIVPEQFSHNVSVCMSMADGRYNVSLECRNLTDERLYDNFSLQKPGRAFYAKFRVSLGSADSVNNK